MPPPRMPSSSSQKVTIFLEECSLARRSSADFASASCQIFGLSPTIQEYGRRFLRNMSNINSCSDDLRPLALEILRQLTGTTGKAVLIA